MLNLDTVERDYVRWYPTSLEPFSREDVNRAPSIRPFSTGLYVHIPYCDKKCSFCNYNVIVKNRNDASARDAVRTYLRAIKDHALQCKEMGWHKDVRFDSLYIGGGTPSFLTADELYDLIDFFRTEFELSDRAEVSVEGNPISLDVDKVRALSDAGTSRLSIGVQSFEPRLLEILGRGVTLEENLKALETVRASKIPVLNIDLIYRNPSQSTEELIDSVRTARDLGVNQISLYPLWVRPKTEFHNAFVKQKLRLPTEQDEFEQLVTAQSEFARLGYEQYNVFDFVDNRSNVCVNTFLQWQDGEWIGIGPGATSYFRGSFFIHTYDTTEYISKIQRKEDTINVGLTLSRQERMERTMIFGLRMFPFLKERFYGQYGVKVESVFGEKLAWLEEQGLLRQDAREIRLTARGIFHVNGISKLFYSPHRKGSLQTLGLKKDGSLILEKDF
ncbi:coproporphyrinogen-III oxidase family protein [Xanthomonas translucens]|uniref:coproporphyrinogen-III oxidase family protein n=1 Tax=Xanthomonas campestris pv. translucens TaxID=343 RepID=UPI0009BDDBC6|nr:coproporphyrinogen-III oxidase family protein [Xanthomonas translucens]